MCPKCTGQSGVQYKLLDYGLPPAGTDAAGLQLLPLTYRRDEIVSGNIQHAGRFTLAIGYIAATEIRWPAQATTGGGPAGKVMPIGSRVRLKAGFSIDSLKSPYAKNLATAFARYGLILADVGGSWQVQAESSVYEPELMAAFQEIYASIQNTDLEVVDESSLMVNKNSAKVNPANGHVNPGSVTVIATDPSGRKSGTNVILQAVTVGVESPWLAIQAGSAPLQIKAWINGTENRGLTWSMTPAVGTSHQQAFIGHPPVSEHCKRLRSKLPVRPIRRPLLWWAFLSFRAESFASIPATPPITPTPRATSGTGIWSPGDPSRAWSRVRNTTIVPGTTGGILRRLSYLTSG